MVLYVLLDIIAINFSMAVAVCLWYGGSIPGANGIAISDYIWQWFVYIQLFATPITILTYAAFRFYSSLWKYANIDDVYKIIIADTVIFVLIFFVHEIIISSFHPLSLSKRMLLIAWIIDIVFFLFSRSGYRLFKRMFITLETVLLKKSGKRRVMIIGAGFGGYNTIRSIQNNEKGYEDRIPIIVVDDDIKKNNTLIQGVRVTHDCSNIPRLSKEYEIEEIIIAIPSATNTEVKRIMDYCTQAECVLKLIPPMSDVSDGSHKVLRDVDIEDLLFREQINIDVASISGYLKGEVILVTGGGGSIGSELCRQIVKFSPEKLVIFDIYENNAFELAAEIRRLYPNVEVFVSIGSICDTITLQRVFEKFSPKVVFHAAAHKHVPLMESVPCEAIKNNVFGTLNVALAADKYGVERFVMLSTDKAVNPSNIMGATKRVTELIIQDMSTRSNTKFMAVRFGNVLGSSGSVVPLFKKQIAQGGPVLVTDPEIVRFFMTIPEAAKLVLQAAGLGKNGMISVLDMGEPVKILELAKSLIRLSGYAPDKDIKIEFTGLRPGEKLYEELILDEEKDDLKVIYKNKIFVTKPLNINSESFNMKLQELNEAACVKCDDKLAVKILKEIVPNFKEVQNVPEDKKDN